MYPEDGRQVGLRIEVDTEWPLLAQGDPGKEIERRGRLANAALLIEYRDDRHLAGP